MAVKCTVGLVVQSSLLAKSLGERVRVRVIRKRVRDRVRVRVREWTHSFVAIPHCLKYYNKPSETADSNLTCWSLLTWLSPRCILAVLDSTDNTNALCSVRVVNN